MLLNSHLYLSKKHDYSSLHAFLVILTMANGLSYDLFIWLGTEHDWGLSPALLLTVSAILTGIKKDSVNPLPVTLLVLWTVCLVIPSSTISWGVLFCIALFSMLNNQKKDAHLLIAVFALSELCSAVAFKIVSFPVLAFESWIITFFVQLISETAYVTDNIIVVSEQHVLSLSAGCSALLNVSAVLLAWISSYYLVNQRLPGIPRVILLILTFFMLNTIRMLLMAIDSSWYTLVHDGYGMQIFDSLIMLLVLSPILVRVKQ